MAHWLASEGASLTGRHQICRSSVVWFCQIKDRGDNQNQVVGHMLAHTFVTQFQNQMTRHTFPSFSLPWLSPFKKFFGLWDRAGSLRQSNWQGVYRYSRCRFYQTGSPSDSQTVWQGGKGGAGCTGVAGHFSAGCCRWCSTLYVCTESYPIAMKPAKCREQYELCALLVRPPPLHVLLQGLSRCTPRTARLHFRQDQCRL